MDSKDKNVCIAPEDNLDSFEMRYKRMYCFIDTICASYSMLLEDAAMGDIKQHTLDRLGWELSYLKEDSKQLLKMLHG